MAEIEDRHWWYRGLRAVIRDAWKRSVGTGESRADLLDVGCGTGANLAALRDLAEPVGIDIAAEAVAFCRRRGLSDTIVGSAEQLPFDSERFDVVLSCDVLSHRSITDKVQPLREITRVLRPGGVLLLNLPAYQSLLSSHDAAVHQDRRFNRRDTRRLVAQAGLSVEWISHWNAALLPATAAVRWLRRGVTDRSSDLAGASGQSLAPALGAVLAAERAIMRRLSLPFGLSVFVIARRPR